MAIEKFEDMLVWQKARTLTHTLYKIFKDSRDFSFRDQLQRASISIMNNAAEGFERRGNKEFQYFLSIAKGSCGEVRSMLYLAHDLKYITNQEFNELSTLSTEISRMLSGLIKKL